jgi:hypothetical protein
LEGDEPPDYLLGLSCFQQKNTTDTKVTKVKMLEAKPFSPFVYFVPFVFEKPIPLNTVEPS